jgi:hypothetical protein
MTARHTRIPRMIPGACRCGLAANDRCVLAARGFCCGSNTLSRAITQHDVVVQPNVAALMDASIS